MARLTRAPASNTGFVPLWDKANRAPGKGGVRTGSYCLACFAVAADHEGVEKLRGGLGDLIDRRVEHGLVVLSGLVKAAHLSHELQRSRSNFLVTRGRGSFAERLDASAHGHRVTGAMPCG